jgi:hypothetical protein
LNLFYILNINILPATWGNIELEDLLYGNAGGTALYRDVKGTYNLNGATFPPPNLPMVFLKNIPPIYESPLLTPNIQFYIVPLAAVEDAISLTFFLNFKFKASVLPTSNLIQIFQMEQLL